MMRNTKGMEKITKRTMALILSAVLAFGSTLTVFAAEETGEPELTNEEKIEAVQKEEVAAVGENPTDEEHGGAAGAIEEAIGEIGGDSVQIFEVSPEVAEKLEEGLTYVAGGSLPENEDGVVQEVTGVNGNLEAAEAGMKKAVAAEEGQEDLVVQAESENELANASINNANRLIDTANNSENEQEATAARDAAQTEVNNTKALIGNVQQKVDALQAQWDQLEKERQEAQKAADTALTAAKNEAGLAAGALAAAQAAAQAATERAAKLEKIQEQYRALMVQYYSDRVISSVVYDGNKVDLNASAAKAYDSGKLNDHPELQNNTWALGGELMKQLVMYKLETKGVDVSTIHFAESESGYTAAKDAAQGTLPEDDAEKETVKFENNYKQYWQCCIKNSDGTANNGRSNHVKVTYTLNGEAVTEYYNYIMKTAKYDDFKNSEGATEEERNAALKEMGKGNVYLALISPKVDSKGKITGWDYAKDGDQSNFDDYEKLTKAVNALSDLENAQKAVDNAKKLVDDLQAEVDKLSNVTFDDEEMNNLLARLNAAKAEKVRLEEELRNAEERLNSIDLSRFEVTTDDDTAVTTGGTTGAAAGTTALPMITSPLTITPIGTLATAFTGAAGAAGAADAADGTSIGDGTLPGGATPSTPGTTLVDDLLPGADKAPTTLGEGELPGAAGVENGVSMWWLWALLVLLLIIAYTVYKYNQKKKEQEQNTVA